MTKQEGIIKAIEDLEIALKASLACRSNTSLGQALYRSGIMAGLRHLEDIRDWEDGINLDTKRLV